MKKSPYMSLRNMISEGKISEKTIRIAAKISEEELNKYIAGQEMGLNSEDIAYLDELTMLIGVGMTIVNQDDRMKGVLESLIDYYGFSTKELSNLLNIRLEVIQNVLDGKENDLNEKYLLSVSAWYLFYALKKKK